MAYSDEVYIYIVDIGDTEKIRRRSGGATEESGVRVDIGNMNRIHNISKEY